MPPRSTHRLLQSRHWSVIAGRPYRRAICTPRETGFLTKTGFGVGRSLAEAIHDRSLPAAYRKERGQAVRRGLLRRSAPRNDRWGDRQQPCPEIPGLLQSLLTLSSRAAALGGEAIPTVQERALGVASSRSPLATTELHRLCSSPGSRGPRCLTSREKCGKI